MKLLVHNFHQSDFLNRSWIKI